MKKNRKISLYTIILKSNNQLWSGEELSVPWKVVQIKLNGERKVIEIDFQFRMKALIEQKNVKWNSSDR